MQKLTSFFSFSLLAFFIAQSSAESPPDPPVRTAQGQGVVGLDFSGSGNDEQIALFVITCNDTPGTFDVKFEFLNACQFKCGTRARPISMTGLVWNHISGNLGSGLIEPVNKDVLHNREPGGTEYIWTPTGVGQKSETNGYIMELKANWEEPAGILSGFYFETIKATVRAKF
jgi:hypothetical protein